MLRALGDYGRLKVFPANSCRTPGENPAMVAQRNWSQAIRKNTSHLWDLTAASYLWCLSQRKAQTFGRWGGLVHPRLFADLEIFEIMPRCRNGFICQA